MKKTSILAIALFLTTSNVWGFLNGNQVPEPMKFLIYDPCRFCFGTDAVNNYVQNVVNMRWGTHDKGYWDRLPNPAHPPYPGDTPETTIEDFHQKLSSGDYGFYMISSHSGPLNLLIEPYCRNNPTQQTQEISKYLADMAWYKYTGEDFYDPNVLKADYDNDGKPLCGRNGEVEYWLDKNGSPLFPPGGLPYDDDLGDFFYAKNDDDEDGRADEDPINNVDDDGDGLIDEDPPGDISSDNAPGIRGDPGAQLGDGESDLPEYTTYGLNELVVLRNDVESVQFYSVYVTTDFIRNYGANSPDCTVYISGCNSYFMADAWMDPPMGIANFIGHVGKIRNDFSKWTVRKFFELIGNPENRPDSWNYSFGEAVSFIQSDSPTFKFAMNSVNRCTAGMVLYQGDIYVDNTPPSNPHGDLGSIANPYTDIQSGLSAASSGETVFVAEGTYNLSTTLTVPPGVTLKGAGPHKTVLVGVNDINIPMFRFDTSFTEVTSIQDFKITGCYDAIAINLGASTPIECPLEIRNNLFETNAYGIRMNRASPTASSFNDPYGLDNKAPQIYNNIIFDNYRDGINCIYTRAHISHNTIENSVIGIYIGYGGGYDFPLVENNIIVYSGEYGIYSFTYPPLMSYPKVTRNTLYENRTDIYCPGCGNDVYLNDLNTNPDQIPGPFSAELGSAGNYYLDEISPARNRASDAAETDDLCRLTTSPEQTPGISGTLSDRGYYYHIRCEDLPTYTPVPTEAPTSTPSGPTPTPTPYQSATPSFTPTPIPTPEGTVFAMGYHEDFEDSVNWTTNGLWHRPLSGSSYSNAHSGEYSMRYGREDLPDYDTGGVNRGELTLCPMYIEGSGAVLTFYSWEQTEGVSTGVDTRTVWASVDNGITWEQIYQSTNNTSEWHLVTVSLPYSDQYVLLQFRFDTVDDEYNNYQGWYIDDVYVGAGPVPSMSNFGYIILLLFLSVIIMAGKRKRV